jgi:hypothetical protein
LPPFTQLPRKGLLGNSVAYSLYPEFSEALPTARNAVINCIRGKPVEIAERKGRTYMELLFFGFRGSREDGDGRAIPHAAKIIREESASA